MVRYGGRRGCSAAYLKRRVEHRIAGKCPVIQLAGKLPTQARKLDEAWMTTGARGGGEGGGGRERETALRRELQKGAKKDYRAGKHQQAPKKRDARLVISFDFIPKLGGGIRKVTHPIDLRFVGSTRTDHPLLEQSPCAA